MKRCVSALTVVAALTATVSASADTFAPNTLIIPMDTTYQNQGMLRAFGLVYKLLSNNIPVRWVVRSGKAYQGVDFTASGNDLQTNAVITNHGYRGGPWVIDSADAAAALPLITAFQTANPTVKVHKASAAFDGDVARLLVAAPTIAMHADGNEDIAIDYLVAAGIPDSTGNYTWPKTSPDLLTPLEVAGPTTTNHHDGKLFDANGTPVYCQFMSMHWNVTSAVANPEVVAEVRAFLGNPVHFFAECQAVNAFENLNPHGFLLTKTGFAIGPKPASVDFLHSDQPFAQLDGPFATVGGSESSYSIPTGGAYKNGDVVMLTEHGTPVGVNDVWMTGYLDGVCPPGSEVCGTLGKVSYLGGHKYETKVPISTNPQSQGTRLFLNSLFEAPCATAVGQPAVSVLKKAPATTTTNSVTFTLEYSNIGTGVALGATLDDPVPAGATFVSATQGGAFSAGAVHWNLGNLAAGQNGSVSFTVQFGSYGDYANTATLNYKVGVSSQTRTSNTTHTQYGQDSDGDNVIDTVDICPNDPNPLQNLQTDPLSCGTCGNVCQFPQATPACQSGVCTIGWCNLGYSDCNGLAGDGCEYASSGLLTDPNNCGYCGHQCAFPEGTPQCSNGACQLGACNSGFSNCNGDPLDGCEYANAGFQSDPGNCGSCGHACDVGAVCKAGVCGVDTCPPGFSDCNGIATDGCEFANSGFQTDVSHCGSCTTVCTTPHATPACVAGACAVGTCAAGYSDCNGVAVDGCEYADSGFSSDPNHCGSCTTPCLFQHADGVCAQGLCAISNCHQGYSDCNASGADGCEYDNAGFASDTNHCGSCSVVCAPAHATGACVAGVCALGPCATGYVDLDQNPTNGCEYACTATATTDTTCDGVDDDCNGATDEGYVSTTCGQGACQAKSKCIGGATQCTPGAPAPEGPAGEPSCSDQADNDCNGLVDTDDPACQSDGGAEAAVEAATDVEVIPDVQEDALLPESGSEPGSDAPVVDVKPDEGSTKDGTTEAVAKGGSGGAAQDGAVGAEGQPAGGSAGMQPPAPTEEDSGCACRVASSSDRGRAGSLLLGIGIALALSSRRRRGNLRRP